MKSCFFFFYHFFIFFFHLCLTFCSVFPSVEMLSFDKPFFCLEGNSVFLWIPFLSANSIILWLWNHVEKRSIVSIQSGWRVGGGGMMKEQLLSSSLLVSIPFHLCHHFLRSLVSMYCRLLGSDGLLVNPRFTLSLVLAQLCWLMMCSVWQSSLWVLAMGGKPWFTSQALISRVDWALIIHDGKLHRAAFRLRHRSSSLLDDFPSCFFSLSPARTPGGRFSSCVGRDL